MLRTFLVFCLLTLTGLSVFGVYRRFTPDPAQINRPLPIVVPPNETVQVLVPEALRKLNQANAQLKGLTADSIQVKIWEGTFSFVLSGYMRYEKPNRFRMIVNTMYGKELDLGSNDEKFWFWTRKSAEPGLFYAKHADYYKTRLKTPFNPVWMMQSLGINEIDTKDARIVDEPGKSVMVMRQDKNCSGVPILVTTFVNRKGLIDSILTTDLQGKALVSAEIKEYEGGLPKWIVYSWFEENRMMEVRLVNPRVGGAPNPKLWEMPNIHPQTDMGVN